MRKSHDPRIVPHLVELLERIVDEPEHHVLASQIVFTLVPVL